MLKSCLELLWLPPPTPDVGLRLCLVFLCVLSSWAVNNRFLSGFLSVFCQGFWTKKLRKTIRAKVAQNKILLVYDADSSHQILKASALKGTHNFTSDLFAAA